MLEGHTVNYYEKAIKRIDDQIKELKIKREELQREFRDKIGEKIIELQNLQKSLQNKNTEV